MRTAELTASALRWFLVMASAATLAGCGLGASDDLDLSAYDQEEVEFLRSQIPEDANVSDSVIVSTLEFREDCRRLQAYINMRSRGESDSEIVDRFSDVPNRFRDRGSTEMADSMEELVASAELGDLATVVEFLANNCNEDPPGSPGGIDGVD